MAMQRKEDPPKGAPAWQSTFSDLMNLLLCFFVLLFAMSTVDAEKFQMVIASMQSSMSILPAGGTSIGDGELVSAGVSQLEFLDSYYNDLANSKSPNQTEGEGSVKEEYKEEALKESEKMAEDIENKINQSGLQDVVDVEFNAQYVKLSLSGAILFPSGKAELVSEAYPIMDKIAKVLDDYQKNIIDIEGHTDNVPINTSLYPNNMMLSLYRAYSVFDFFVSNKGFSDQTMTSSGRGDAVPIADNGTPEGRAQNRRVEIKVYNAINS